MDITSSCRSRMLGGLVALACAGGLAPARAADSGALFRQLGQIIEQTGRALAEDQRRQEEEEQRAAENARREQELQAQREREAAARQREQREAARQEQERALRALAPPPEYQDRIVIHKSLLGMQETGNARPDFDITARTTISISPDGAWLAFEATDGRIMLRDTASGKDRVVPTRVPPGQSSRSLAFVGNEALLVSGLKNGSEVVDLQGNSLRTLPPSAYFPWSKEVGGRYIVQHLRMSDSDKGLRCLGVSYYDARGVDLGGVSVDDAEACAARIDDKGRQEFLAHKDGVVSYYVNGVKTGEFRGDDRRPAEQYKRLGYQWIGNTPYAYSEIGEWDNPSHRLRVWDVAQGKMLCELPGHVAGIPYADKRGNILTAQPPVRVSLPDCSMVRVSNGNKRLMGWGEIAYLHDEQTGKVDVMDPSTWQRRITLQTLHRRSPQDRSFSGVFQELPGHPDQVLVTSYATESQIPAQLFDTKTGQLLRTLPPGRFQAGYIIQQDLLTGQSFSWRSRLWRLAYDDGAGKATTAFLAALKKDKFETSAEYQKRLATLTMPHTMKVALRDYDADRGMFIGTWRNVQVSVPLPPAQARQFADAKEMSMTGDLRAIDEDYLELRNASVTTPGGQVVKLALPDGPAPKIQPRPQAVRQGEGAGPVAGAAAARATAGAQGGRCTGTMAHLAPQLRPYTTPMLADTRKEILEINVASTLAKVKAGGGTAAMLREQADQFDRAARDAATTANQSDGGGNSIAKADGGTLPLNWPCEGIHSSAVCGYIIMRWQALVTRELASIYSTCQGG
ncbi:hypothetical protein N5K27_10425 [Pigmentiphaga sp. GD03639]|uniref:hypothetical protein n=1 Tax=unclassified Pigmentiphaga TaxID=2626614 RepID=UPI00104B762C|nr:MULTISPECIES: hypothetical protein [unclassified Pigmentiphaga]MDH2236713.1 hypothetical protein [Pigmentiphaga sp. GD03639]